MKKTKLGLGEMKALTREDLNRILGGVTAKDVETGRSSEWPCNYFCTSDGSCTGSTTCQKCKKIPNWTGSVCDH